MKKVLMIVPSFTAKGGITTVVNGYKNSILEKEYNLKFVETYCDGNKLKKLFKFIFSYIKVFFIMLFWRPNLVHIHSSFGPSFFRKKYFIDLAYLYHCPIINHIHGSYFNEFYFEASIKKQKTIRKTYGKCDIIIALSENAKLILEKIVSEDIIQVIENFGVFNYEAIQNRREKNLENVVLFLGFITQKKGCYDIPKIAKIVKQKIPEVKFVLGGTGEIDRIKDLCDAELLESIEFPGWIRGEDKDKLLKRADLFFLPSYSEGMPMSILDAMGYGLPVVSSNVGGIPKIVHNDINGYMFNPGDNVGMAEAIIKILLNKDLRNRLGEGSVNILKNGYSFEHHAKKLINLYEICLKGKIDEG